jgi:hemerythrin-like domain-containing protein
VIDRPPTTETRRALDSALRYFKEAAPKHTADEEESLFPRLRQTHAPEMESALSSLDRLDNDHRWAAPLHSRVDQLGSQYLSTAQLSDNEVNEFRTSVTRLVAMYKEHIGIEDQIVFPLATRILSGNDKSEIAAEMAKRRNVAAAQS